MYAWNVAREAACVFMFGPVLTFALIQAKQATLKWAYMQGLRSRHRLVVAARDFVPDCDTVTGRQSSGSSW